jgi:putative phosphoribosyl transferase
VPVASEVAAALDAPLDVIIVRKLGIPFQPELAMGAVAEDGVIVLDTDLIARAAITDSELRTVERRERAALDRQVAQLRRGRPRAAPTGRVAVIVDDGIATGSTARAACQVARRYGALRVVLAAPVAPHDVASRLPEADAVVCVLQPASFIAVGAHYRDFSATTEKDVVTLLAAADERMTSTLAADPAPHGPAREP